MFSRRTFSTALGSLVLAGAARPLVAQDVEVSPLPPGPGSAETHLRVFLEGREVGTWEIALNRDEDALRVDTLIDIVRTRFAGLPVDSYTLETRETWSGGLLRALKSTARGSGERREVRAGMQDGSLHLEGPGYEGQVPANTGTSSLFSRDMLERATWIDTDSGQLLSISSDLGRRVKIGGTEFDEYLVSSETEAKLFYTDDGRFGGAVMKLMGASARILPGQVSAIDPSLG